MIITNATKDDQGEWKFDMQLTEQEVSYFTELSITSLIKVGMIAITEQTEPQEVHLPNQNAPTSGAIQ